MEKKSYSFFEKNGLSLLFVSLFLVSLAGQICNGRHEHNEFLKEYGQQGQSLFAYIRSGHFLQATFENWESEFFQMALFVMATVALKQRGSSESNSMEEDYNAGLECSPKPGSPWPVKRGGLYLRVYKHSLSIVLMLLFVISFLLHWYGSWLDFEEKQWLEHKAGEDFFPYLCHSKFWFESFQNWQSEFLSVFSIIFLSIYLRQVGSSQSKPVNASHKETGI
jgi:hypothetical protein